MAASPGGRQHQLDGGQGGGTLARRLAIWDVTGPGRPGGGGGGGAIDILLNLTPYIDTSRVTPIMLTT